MRAGLAVVGVGYVLFACGSHGLGVLVLVAGAFLIATSRK